MIPVLSTLGIKPPVQDFFAPWLKVTAKEEIGLVYPGQEKSPVWEIISPYGSLVPTTSGIWCAGANYPLMARHNFLFYSATEALCFCSMNTHWLARPGSAVFSALGLLPSTAQIGTLRLKFPHARLHVVFGSDLPGRVMDCKAALWSKEKNGHFRVQQDGVAIRYGGKTFLIPEPKFSLHRFEQQSGLRAGLRAHKPKAGFSSFLEMIRAGLL
ncbi:MAG: hypothetical protein V4546_05390 [Bacteroidota bacterium]